VEAVQDEGVVANGQFRVGQHRAGRGQGGQEAEFAGEPDGAPFAAVAAGESEGAADPVFEVAQPVGGERVGDRFQQPGEQSLLGEPAEMPL